MEGIYSADHFFDQVRQAFENERYLSPLRDAVRNAPDWKARLRAIRALYKKHEELGEDFACFDPYSLELHDYWTPIEWRLWQDVRTIGRCRFLPQFPVGQFFLDFADPKAKVGIEADGKQFHDVARDRLRDQRLWDEHGWKVFRVSGAETFRVRPSPWEWRRDYREQFECWPQEDQLDAVAREFYSTTSTGVVYAIRDAEIDPQGGQQFLRQKFSALDEHRLADFPLGATL